MTVEVIERTVREYRIVLAEEDLASRNPYEIGERVLDLLKPHLPTGESSGRQKAKPGRNQQLTLGRRNGREQTGPKDGRGRGQSSEKVPCPECDRLIARKFLKIHRETKHGVGGNTTTRPATESLAAESA